MPIVAECPQCGRKGNVPDQYHGRSVKCPDCAKPFTIGGPTPVPAEPAPASPPANGSALPPGVILAECPECGFTGRVPEKARGVKVKCRKCGESFVVGASPPAPTSTEPAAETSDGPSVKVIDVPGTASTDDEIPEEIGLAPSEEETKAADTTVKAETDLDVVEDAEVIDDVEVVEAEEAKPAKPKKTRPSNQGAAKAPAEAESPWGSLDEPTGKKSAPRAERRRKMEEEVQQKTNLALIVGGAGGGILLVLAVCFAGIYFVGGNKDEKTKVASAPPPGKSPPVVAPPTLVRKLPPTRPVVKPPEKRPVFDPPPKPEDPPPEKKQPDPPEPKDDGWVDASRNPARLGNALIRVTGARVDTIGLKLRDAKVGDTKDYLILQIELENTSKTDAIRYTGWGATRAKPGEDVPTLADETGNFYRRIVLEDLQGQVNQEQIQPGKKLDDTLIFEVPAEKAAQLRLELPGRYLGGQGKAQLRIPMHMVTTKAPAKDPGPPPVADETQRVKALRKTLWKAKDAPTRMKLLGELGKLRAEAKPAVPDIALFLKDRNDQVRSAAAESLAFIGPDARAAIAPLIAALKDDFWMVRAHAATALGAIGPEAKAAIPRLRELAKTRDEEVPERAAEALRRIEAKRK